MSLLSCPTHLPRARRGARCPAPPGGLPSHPVRGEGKARPQGCGEKIEGFFIPVPLSRFVLLTRLLLGHRLGARGPEQRTSQEEKEEGDEMPELTRTLGLLLSSYPTSHTAPVQPAQTPRPSSEPAETSCTFSHRPSLPAGPAPEDSTAESLSAGAWATR